MAGATEAGLKFLEVSEIFSGSAAAYTRARSRRSAALYNEKAATAEAEDAREVGNSAAARRTAEGDRQKGTVRARAAGRGFTRGVGTAGDVEAGADLMTRLDALTIRENTSKQVLAKRLEAGSYRMAAASEDPESEAIGTALGGAARVARRWTE